MAERSVSLRSRIFFCRTRVDRAPGLLWVLEVVSGAVLLAHPAAALLLLSLSQEDLVGHALVPLTLLCSEVCVLSLVILSAVVCDLVKRKSRGISVWQREALGRLLRNFFMSLLLGISLSYTYLSWEPGSHLSTSLLELLVPAGVAALIGSIKVLMVRTEQGWFWLWLCLCGFLQMALLVLKHDIETTLPWSVVLLPLDLMALDALFLAYAKAEQRMWQKTGLLLASLLLLVTCVAAGLCADTGLVPVSLVLLSAWVSMITVLATLTRACGAYVLDIVWGHVETDFFYYKYPVLLTRQHTV